MGAMEALAERMTELWSRVHERYGAYGLVLPSTPRFICQAEACIAHCCKVFSVALNERELERMQRFSKLEAVELLECEDGQPISLPLSDPYLLKRSNGQCAMLGHDLLCGQYEGRPDACRLYPHQVIFMEPGTGRPAAPDLSAFRHSLHEERYSGGLVPMLLRHMECPGFTGEPLGRGGWMELLEETYRLQYHDREPFGAEAGTASAHP